VCPPAEAVQPRLKFSGTASTAADGESTRTVRWVAPQPSTDAVPTGAVVASDVPGAVNVSIRGSVSGVAGRLTAVGPAANRRVDGPHGNAVTWSPARTAARPATICIAMGCPLMSR